MRSRSSHLTDEDARYLSHLRAESLATLKVALRGHTEVAFVGLPSHRNLGDSMIAAGTMAYLKRLGVRIRYLSDIYTFDRAVLAGLPAPTPVLFQGGGNLGDLYPWEEQFRLDIIAREPKRRYIFLPQTIHFEQAENIDRSAAGYAVASDLTMLVRDKPSEVFVHKHFGGSEVLWSPDYALGWTPSVRFQARDRGLMVVARTDGESRPGDRGRAAADLVLRSHQRRRLEGRRAGESTVTEAASGISCASRAARFGARRPG